MLNNTGCLQLQRLAKAATVLTIMQYKQLLLINLIMQTSHSVQSDPIPTLRSSISSTFLKHNNHTTFITTQKPIKPTPETLITQHYQQLNRYIDLLEPKIQKIVEYNEAEVLIAYRNHFGKIKEEIELFKQQTLDQVKNQANVLAKMADMERQLVVFREEALRLFQLVGQKDKIIEQLNLKLEEMIAEKAFMDNKLKELMRATKEFKAQESINHFQESNTLKKSEVLGNFYSVGIHTFKKSINRYRKIKERTLTLSNCQHAKAIQSNNQEEYTKSNFLVESKVMNKQNKEIKNIFRIKFGHLEDKLLDDIIKTAQDVYSSIDRSRQWGFTKTPNTTDLKRTKCSTSTAIKIYPKKILSEHKIRSHTKSTFRQDLVSSVSYRNKELSQYFQKCIETVKKEIGRRKNSVSLNFFNGSNPLSLADFKKIDFYRLAELVFSNDKVTKLLYDSLVTA